MTPPTNRTPLELAAQTIAAIAAYGRSYLDEPEFRADFDGLWSRVPRLMAEPVIQAERENDLIGTYFHNLREIAAL